MSRTPCGPYIQTFLVWPFMPNNRNFTHSVWLILYSKPLDLKCMKWIKSTLRCDFYTKINLFFYNAQLWAPKIGQPCSIENAWNRYVKYVHRNHFLERLHNAWKETIPHPLFRHLFLSLKTVHALILKSVQSSLHHQQPARLQFKTSPVP